MKSDLTGSERRHTMEPMLRWAVSVALLASCTVSGRDVAQDGGDEPEPTLSPAERRALAELSPDPLPLPPEDVSNRWADDPDAAALGQTLFFDPSFSGELLDGDNDGRERALGAKGETGKVSCAGCHLPEAGFSDTRSLSQQISLGAGWGKRRAPSLLDVGQSSVLMWDGRRDALFNQIFGVLESAVEANSSRLFTAHQVFARYRDAYEALFGPLPALDDTARFPMLLANETGCRQLNAENECSTVMRGAPGDSAEFDGMAAADQDAVNRVVVNIGKALGAYQRLLTCGPSRFDAWVHGDEAALSPAEKRGAALFVGRARCSECHTGPYLSDEAFHNVGLRPKVVATAFLNLNDSGASEGIAELREDPLNVAGSYSDGDDGRIPEVSAQLLGAFRTPRLRCVAQRPSFMHSGQMRSLEEVVEFFSRGGDEFGYPGSNELTPLDLSEREQADLVEFLNTLNGPGPNAELLTPP